MPAKPIIIGQLHFPRKGDALTYLKTMLNKYDVGDKVGAADALILTDALVLHPLASEIIGCGVLSFSVRSADYGTQCFWVNRIDGTTEKFSYINCLSSK